MSEIIRPLPDLRQIAMIWLEETFPEKLAPRAGTPTTYLVRSEVPTDVRALLAHTGFFVAVATLPGRSNRHEVTAPIDFDVFALTDGKSGDLSRDIDARLARGFVRTKYGASLQNVTNRMSPATVPWADAAVRRYMSSYTVTARR